MYCLSELCRYPTGPGCVAPERQGHRRHLQRVQRQKQGLQHNHAIQVYYSHIYSATVKTLG